MKKIWTAAAAMAGGIALVAATQGTSQAAEATQSVPGCVTGEVHSYPLSSVLVIENDCDTTQSVRPVFTYGDGPCFTLAPGESVTRTLTDLAGIWFEGLESC